MEERLQKILAGAGICSRRKAEELILAGRVRVDGVVVTALGTKVDPERHAIVCDGRPVRSGARKIYLLLHKPVGYVTTMRDPQGRPVVTELLSGFKERLFPVGRLDVDTSGALVLTNDGEFGHRILHPRFEISRTYEALVSGYPSESKLDTLRAGIDLDGRRTSPAVVELLRRTRNGSVVKITIHEGRKRQVRRMFDAIGHPVAALKRTAYGGLTLGDLPPGEFRRLDGKDLRLLFQKKR
ncbi:MAG: pseudouridine synthase [Thermodesulfobacteriota bacterium]